MKDDEKIREQLVIELKELRSQNASLKKSITGGISAKLAVEKARRYAKSIVETVREPLLVLDADLKIISANRNFHRTFKLTPDETIGSFIYDLGNKQWDIPKLRELLEEILPEKEAFDDFEVAHNFQNIGQKTMLLNAREIYRKAIGTKMILLAIEDITGRKQVEKALQQSEERYQSLFEQAGDGIFILDTNGKILSVNKSFASMHGFTVEEMLRLGLEGLDVEGPTHLPDRVRRLMRGETLSFEVEHYHKDGHTFPLAVTANFISSGSDRLMIAIHRDLTERKRMEAARRESEALLFNAFNNSPLLMTISDLSTGRYLQVNDSFCMVSEFSREEAIGKTSTELGFIGEEERARMVSELHQHGKIAGLELVLRNRRGKTLICRYSGDIIQTAEGDKLFSAAEDITDRVRQENEIKELGLKNQRILNAAGDGIYGLNIEGQITFINPSAAKMLGYDNQELIGKGSHDTFHHTRSDGSPYKGEDCPIYKSFKDGIAHYQESDFFIRKDGTSIPVEYASSPITDNGEVIGGVVAFRNITERKEAEKKLLETLESLRRSFGTIIQVMVSAIEVRDPYTAGHQIRSADLARAIAAEMGLSREKIEGIRMAGSIHDIGKISIPAEILSKPKKLTEIELSLIKEHSLKGYEMLKDVESPWPLAEIVYQHHEKMDGSGYPRNMKGDDILIEARILAVADVVESMASYRPYRPAIGIDAALEEIEKNRGIFYDNAVADACLRLFREKGFQLEGA